MHPATTEPNGATHISVLSYTQPSLALPSVLPWFPQMDGLARGSELVFVLAATNLPWELDMVG